MKKLLALVMAVVMMFLLTACGESKQETTPASTKEEAAGTTEAEESLIGKYPVKTLNIIVPYSAGGDTDIYARLIQERLEKILGINVVVNNMTGGSATVAGNYVLTAAPDGATALWTHTANLIQMINGVANYNIIEDFEYVCTAVADRSNTIVVMKDSPYQTLDDLVKAAKANPGSIKFSPPTQPATFEIMEKLGIEFNRVNVGSNASERVVGLMNGQIDVLLSNYVSVADYVEAGEMRVLAMVSNPFTPKNPTFKAAGYDITDAKYYELRLPKGTDKAVVELLSKAISQIVKDPEFIAKLQSFYAEPCFRDAAESYQFDKELAAYMGTLNGGNLK